MQIWIKTGLKAFFIALIILLVLGLFMSWITSLMSKTFLDILKDVPIGLLASTILALPIGLLAGAISYSKHKK